MNYIVLYADDYNYDVWEEYCDICDVPYYATYIKINFKSKDVEFDDNDE